MFMNRNNTEILNENIILLCLFNKYKCNYDDDFEIRSDENGYVSYSFKGKSSYVAGQESGFELALNLTGIKL